MTEVYKMLVNKYDINCPMLLRPTCASYLLRETIRLQGVDLGWHCGMLDIPTALFRSDEGRCPPAETLESSLAPAKTRDRQFYSFT